MLAVTAVARGVASPHACIVISCQLLTAAPALAQIGAMADNTEAAEAIQERKREFISFFEENVGLLL